MHNCLENLYRQSAFSTHPHPYFAGPKSDSTTPFLPRGENLSVEFFSVITHPPPGCNQVILRGGTKQISIFAFSNLLKALYLHFTPKMSHFGLKMLLWHFSSKFGKNNFSIFSRFRGIPDREKKNFTNFFFQRAILSPSLNIFWRDRWHMKDNSIWHIAMKR